MENTTPSTHAADAAKAGTPNGVPGAQTSRASAEEARRQAMQRAEELVDRWGQQIGQWASSFGRSILQWAARTREEAEDIWAEAQSIRRGGKPPEA